MSLFESASLVVTPNGTKATKLYAIKPTSGAGDLILVRNTTATRVNSAGLIESVAVNVPRLDYTNSTCPSILVEPQRTNLVLYSEQFDNAYWGKFQATITANTTTAPNGTLTADTITDDTNFGGHVVFKTGIWSTSEQTLSIFVKAGTSSRVCILNNSLGTGVFANLANNTIVVDSGFVGTLTAVEDGWYRITATHTAMGSQTLAVGLFIGTSTTEYVGTGSTAFIWGAQLEAGSYSTSYIPTVASSVTRNADVISKTGISSLIGQTEGTLFVDFVCNGFTDFGTPFCINDGSTANSIWITTFADGTIRGEVFGFSNVQATFSMSGGVVGQRYKLALVYKQNDFAMYVNGNLIGSDTSGTVPANFSRADFDYTNASVFVKSALEINTAILWKTRLTNAELAEITTL